MPWIWINLFFSITKNRHSKPPKTLWSIYAWLWCRRTLWFLPGFWSPDCLHCDQRTLCCWWRQGVWDRGPSGCSSAERGSGPYIQRGSQAARTHLPASAWIHSSWDPTGYESKGEISIISIYLSTSTCCIYMQTCCLLGWSTCASSACYPPPRSSTGPWLVLVDAILLWNLYHFFFQSTAKLLMKAKTLGFPSLDAAHPVWVLKLPWWESEMLRNLGNQMRIGIYRIWCIYYKILHLHV